VNEYVFYLLRYNDHAVVDMRKPTADGVPLPTALVADTWKPYEVEAARPAAV
jgi:hypothetical protein